MSQYPIVLIYPEVLHRWAMSEDGPAARAVTRKAVAVEAAIKRRCPVDTGRLRASITWRLGVRETVLAVIGSNVEYAGWVNRGTGIYGPHATPIVPRVASRLVFKPRGSDTVIFARSVKGMPGRHFIEDGLREVDPSARITPGGG